MFVCDLAETYNILDYRSLPLKTVATLTVGLRENSRLNQKRNGVKAPQNTILLASIVDRLGLIITALTGEASGGQIISEFVDKKDEKKQKNIESFSSVSDYLAVRYGGIT